jgi:isoquinoline 1-oxidoreductase beta subunit
MRHGYFRPPTHHTLRARLENGRIAALEHQQASGHVAFDFLPAAMMQVLGADFGAWRGARVMYGIPHRKAVAWRDSLPVPTGWWRGLGLLANTFALESFIDELAHTAGRDPIDFRLDHLPDDQRGPRLKAVLEQVAERSGWRNPAPTGTARGVACCSDAGTIVAHVAEVQVTDGRIVVGRITSVVDPGLPINPDGVIAQTQGSIVMGLSSTLIEQITIRDSQVSASNFDGYPLITLAETPEIDVFVLRSGDTPYGMGEPPIGPVAAAVANAVFRLTGQRLRQLPLRLTAAS